MGFVDEVMPAGAVAGDGSQPGAAPAPGEDPTAATGGGDVVFEVAPVRDLSWLGDHPHQRAESGRAGSKSRRTGADGRDVVVRVPDGTRIEDENGFLADLVGTGTRAVVARGGSGGRGNASLVTSRNRVPRAAEAGERGDDVRLNVELRIVADVGLVGLPNAGKSTLLATLTAAHPKIADYPFTTLTPNLGVAGGDEERFVVADIPGLVEGASEAGLRHRFCAISRCAPSYSSSPAAPDPEEISPLARRSARSTSTCSAVRRSSSARRRTWRPTPTRCRSSARTRSASPPCRATAWSGSERACRTSRRAPCRSRRSAGRTWCCAPPARRSLSRGTATGSGDRRRGAPRRRADLDDPKALARLQRRLVKEGVERELVAAGVAAATR
jgi:hypothetical protein